MDYRVGLGTDLHPLDSGSGFVLCGVFIECPFRTVAVSDGDAAFHALVDALLGAMGMGDIGDHYPENQAVRGETSARYVEETAQKLRARGGRVANVDLVIDLERPKLGERKREMANAIARLLGIPASRVNVKAKTGEGIGPIGLGQAVGAQAVVLVEVPDC